MQVLLLFLFSINSSYFLKLSPGVMSQGLGGVSVIIDEGLGAFHNPAHIQSTKFNFTVSRWLYSTHFVVLGAHFKNTVLGLSYLNYGNIQGYDENGVATHEFNPYTMCLVFAKKVGLFAVSIKAFGEKIDSYSLYGMCGGVSSYIDFGRVAVGAKIDNIGKEFGQNTTIPFTTSFGIKYTLPANIDVLVESDVPDLAIHSGLLYTYENIKLLFGVKYIKPQNVIDGADFGLHLSDFSFATGLIAQVKSYDIGYSFMYTEFSNSHNFSIVLRP